MKEDEKQYNLTTTTNNRPDGRMRFAQPFSMIMEVEWI